MLSVFGETCFFYDIYDGEISHLALSELQVDFTWKDYPGLTKNVIGLLRELPNTKTILNWAFRRFKPS